jgi:DNA-binding CsgD family transcriptional regulator/AraC-like DNA-binding protein
MRCLYGNVDATPEGPFEWHASVVLLGPMTIIDGHCTAPMAIDLESNTHVISMSRGGTARVKVSGTTADIAPSRGALLISPGRRIEWRTPAAFNEITVRIESEYLASQFEVLTGQSVQSFIDFDPISSTAGGAGALIERMCHFIVDEVRKGAHLQHPALITSLQESLARTLLTSHKHNHEAALKRSMLPSGEAVVKMVEDYIDAFAGGPISATDIVAHTGVPLPSIEAAFQKCRYTSLVTFMRQRRLERARQTLMADPCASMTLVAQAAGYLRIEPFAAAYFKTYHEIPAQTRARGLVHASVPMEKAPDSAKARVALLSVREREVCALVVQGMLNKQIAAELGITERTVKEHRGRAMKKLGVDSAVGLSRLWERVGG